MKKIIFLLLLIAASCADESPRFTIPVAPVNLRIDVNGYDYELKTPLSYKIFTENMRRSESDRFGFAGVFLVSDANGSSIFAYDLCCPYEDKRDVTVVPRADGKARCSSCGSIFVTMYGLGSVESGVATEPLQSYKVVPLQQGSYRILN
jgi:hypothetical protein